MWKKLCKCTQCSGTYIDTRQPQTGKLYLIGIGQYEPLKEFVGGFIACPSCSTDEYLTDYKEEK